MKDQADFEMLLADLLEKKIIEPSSSMWLNPVVLTRKKNGSLRFCVDFRRLNDLVTLDEFEIPKVNELFAYLRDKRYFSLIDLQDGFFQIPVNESDREKTAFFSGRQLYQFRKMPQGFKNSPAIFQRGMNLIFSDMIKVKCLIYIDDILIFGATKSEHDKNLEEILLRLKEYGLKENVEKRITCKEEVKFLGYEIKYNKIKPSQERTQGICDFKEPKSRKEVQRFLGMINYDRIFIKNATEILKPLYELLRKENKFKWDEKLRTCFENIKHKWKEDLELRIPDVNKSFTLESDASNIGIGAVLKQEDVPVAYISRTLNKSEMNYGITEREVLAAMWAMEKFESYLFGKKFILITDHKAIEEICRKKGFGSAKTQRWFERINRFHFDVKYRKGQELIGADALSRSVIEPISNVTSINDKNSKILEIHKRMNHRKSLMNLLKKMNIQISAEQLRNIIRKCEICNRKDPSNKKTNYFVKMEKPGDRIALDMLELTSGDLIITAIDYFSRKMFAKTVKSKNSKKILQFLKEIYSVFPFRELLTDNGREFKNKEVLDWITQKNINHKFSIPYYHQSNGRIERANRTIRAACKKTKGMTKIKLAEIIENYNKMFHRGIGMSPNEAALEKNWNKVREHEKKYCKEFKGSTYEKLNPGDRVFIKNELRRNKMDDFFRNRGTVIRNEYGDIYEVKAEEGIIRRHVSQLRRC